MSSQSTDKLDGNGGARDEAFVQLILRLYRTLATPHDDFQTQINTYIEIGVNWFHLKRSVISRVSNSVYTVISSNVDSQLLSVSDQIPLNDTCCYEVLEKKTAVGIAEVSESQRKRLFYKGHSVGSYIGCPLIVDKRLYGTLCFWADSVREKDFDVRDYEVLDLIASGVARSIELKAKSPSFFDQANSVAQMATHRSLGGGKAINHGEQSFTQEAIECLARRVGNSQLTIANLAEDMTVSSRTLQRRLKEHNISFGELRDHVRYRYAISKLIDMNTNIEDIALALDFSDRTSFTNAFKRWTGLSPSSFRRVYKQYN